VTPLSLNTIVLCQRALRLQYPCPNGKVDTMSFTVALHINEHGLAFAPQSKIVRSFIAQHAAYYLQHPCHNSQQPRLGLTTSHHSPFTIPTLPTSLHCPHNAAMTVTTALIAVPHMTTHPGNHT
jgi:hypothetical protein